MLKIGINRTGAVHRKLLIRPEIALISIESSVR
jgi:hypothetical protein